MKDLAGKKSDSANWWASSFKAGLMGSLYDMIAPPSYRRSIEKSFDLAGLEADSHVADFGSGSGLSIPTRAEWLRDGGRMTQFELTSDGIHGAWKKARRAGLESQLKFVQADLTAFDPTPYARTFDAGVAHFSVYVLPKDSQVNALKSMVATVKSGGRFVFSVPSEDYSAKNIAKTAMAQLSGFERRPAVRMFKKFLTWWKLEVGLQKVSDLIDAGVWSKYTRDEARELAEAAGLKVLEIVGGYDGNGYHVVTEVP